MRSTAVRSRMHATRRLHRTCDGVGEPETDAPLRSEASAPRRRRSRRRRREPRRPPASGSRRHRNRTAVTRRGGDAIEAAVGSDRARSIVPPRCAISRSAWARTKSTTCDMHFAALIRVRQRRRGDVRCRRGRAPAAVAATRRIPRSLARRPSAGSTDRAAGGTRPSTAPSSPPPTIATSTDASPGSGSAGSDVSAGIVSDQSERPVNAITPVR